MPRVANFIKQNSLTESVRLFPEVPGGFEPPYTVLQTAD